eukprot:3014807-Pyramimonas_sp.AAC.1
MASSWRCRGRGRKAMALAGQTYYGVEARLLVSLSSISSTRTAVSPPARPLELLSGGISSSP